MQNNNQIKLITVPRIHNSPICQVLAISSLLAVTFKGHNAPPFQVKHKHDWILLSGTQVRRCLTQVFSRSRLEGAGYTFHTFRHSAATFAFRDKLFNP